MATQTLTLCGERFVVIPEKEYRLLKASRTPTTARVKRASKPVARASQARQDAGDVAEVRRRASEPVKSLDEVVAELDVRPKSSRR